LFNIFGTKFATAVNKTDKVSYEKYILFLLLIMTVSFDAQNKMLMMRVNGLNSESIMVCKRRICNTRVKDAVINNKKIPCCG
jgi:hypothetical protein